MAFFKGGECSFSRGEKWGGRETKELAQASMGDQLRSRITARVSRALGLSSSYGF